MGIETSVLLAYAAVGSAVVGVGSALYSADQQRKTAHGAGDQAQADADAAAGQAMVQADKIRKAGKERQQAAVAALAGSGVDVQTGTAELIQTDIGQRSEEDALTAILNGRNARTRGYQQAAIDNISADNAQTAGYINAGSSVLSSVAASRRYGSGSSGSSGFDLSRTNRGSGD